MSPAKVWLVKNKRKGNVVERTMSALMLQQAPSLAIFGPVEQVELLEPVQPLEPVQAVEVAEAVGRLNE